MSKGNGYQCVIFDWDGTLMNSEARIVDAIQSAASESGLPVLAYDVSKQIIGLSLEKAIATLYPEANESQIDTMARAYTHCFLETSDVEMLPFDGVESLLNDLRSRGVLTAIATGKSRKGLNRVLEDTGFGPLFDMTRTPVESESKPSPLMLEQILQEFELDARDAVMVGDTAFDMLMAQRLGMDRIALGHGVHDIEQLKTFDPVACFEDLSSMQRWLEPNTATYSVRNNTNKANA